MFLGLIVLSFKVVKKMLCCHMSVSASWLMCNTGLNTAAWQSCANVVYIQLRTIGPI